MLIKGLIRALWALVMLLIRRNIEALSGLNVPSIKRRIKGPKGPIWPVIKGGRRYV